MDKKFKAFLEIARALNKYGIVPIIYGSLGFYKLISQQLDEIGDTDIVVPTEYVTDIDKFPELKGMMEEIGYKQDPNYHHEFSKGDGQISFEPSSDLANLNINVGTLKIGESEGAQFKELSLEDYLKVYNRNLATWEAKVSKIKKKIGIIENLLKK